MLIGYFDWIIIGTLIFLNIKFWKKEIRVKAGYLIGGLLFGFVLPLISLIIEVQRVNMTKGIIDNFEVLYTYLRFPTYWILGVIQIIIIRIKSNFRKTSELKGTD